MTQSTVVVPEKKILLKDHFVPMKEKLERVAESGIGPSTAKQFAKLTKGVLYRDDGVDHTGRNIFTKVAENTVTLGGAIAALEKLTGVEAAFKPKTLNEILNINHNVQPYDLTKTNVALFGVGIGGATLTFDEVFDPSPRQNNVAQMVPMMVSQTELTGTDAPKYMMRSTLTTPGGTTLNSWYLKELESEPIIRSLWKDAPEEDEDGTEITADVADVESENGVESFASFKLIIKPDDIRSYFEAIGELRMARINTIGLYLGEKVTIDGVTDYVNVSLFSVLNLNNEPLAERKKISYIYRVYAMV